MFQPHGHYNLNFSKNDFEDIMLRLKITNRKKIGNTAHYVIKLSAQAILITLHIGFVYKPAITYKKFFDVANFL